MEAGGGGGCGPHFPACSAFFSHFPGMSLSVMWHCLVVTICEEQWVLWAPKAPEIRFR